MWYRFVNSEADNREQVVLPGLRAKYHGMYDGLEVARMSFFAGNELDGE